MPDISMCKNPLCTLRQSCYRHVENTQPNPYRQSYGGFSQDENGLCNFYWKIELEDE